MNAASQRYQNRLKGLDHHVNEAHEYPAKDKVLHAIVPPLKWVALFMTMSLG
jgi:hypothetical protein